MPTAGLQRDSQQCWGSCLEAEKPGRSKTRVEAVALRLRWACRLPEVGTYQRETGEAEGVPPQRRYSTDQIYREVEEDRGRKDKDTLEEPEGPKV